MFYFNRIVAGILLLLWMNHSFANELSSPTIHHPEWSFMDDFEGEKNREFWVGNGIYHTYGAVDPTDTNNKVLKLSYIPNNAGNGDSWAGHDFKLPVDAVQLKLSWKQYVPANYHRLKNFQNFFTLWSGSSGMKSANIALGSSLWGRYADSGSLASIRAGIDGIDYGHNMNSNQKLMLENEAGKWVNLSVYIELAKDAQSFGKMNLYKDGELITGTSSETLMKAYGGVPQGTELIQYATRGNYINQGKLFGWASGSFDEPVDFLIDDFQVSANTTFESADSHADFVDFQGAKADQALIDDLMNQHFSIHPAQRVIYVAPFIPGSTAEGSGDTEDDPRRNLKAVLENAQPGDHIYLAPGIYRIDQERDNFSRKSSLFILDNSGTADNKIVLKTDPNRFDPKNGVIAQIDFGFDNSHPNHDNHAFGLYGSHWVFEDLEIRNFNDWGFYISGKYNLIRNNNIHHVHHIASNNTGLIVIAGSGQLNNLVMNNHLHHSGRMDQTGNLLPASEQTGSNGGCTYSVTRQHYATYENLNAAGINLAKNKNYPWQDMSWEDISQYIAPSDDHVYFYRNLVDHCFPYGLATKNEAEGKFYFLSNVIHSAKHGIKITLSHSQVRNNIIYKDTMMEDVIHFGSTPNGIKIVPQIMNAVDIHITNNTFVGTDIGIIHRAGWNSEVSNNLFLDIPEPHYIQYNYYAWALVTGEYLFGDLDSSHPYFDEMPQGLRDQIGHYQKLRSENNVYTTDPSFKTHVSEEHIDYLPTNRLSDNYSVLSSETIRAYLVDPEHQDYRINRTDRGPLDDIGSGIQ